MEFKYIKEHLNDDVVCPYCGSRNTLTEGTDENTLSRQGECHDCGHTWFDCLRVVGVTEDN